MYPFGDFVSSEDQAQRGIYNTHPPVGYMLQVTSIRLRADQRKLVVSVSGLQQFKS